ncbi:MAG: protein phosphatase 2C domain-containing protein [Anaerolineales bacterium]|nr:protein phosphatase 2C domain-containing protein [Anaerolineales bacterium]
MAAPLLFAGWRVLGASVVGTAHRRADKPCQDAHAYRVLGDGALLVVADGAGSSAYSDEGARLAADTALAALVEAVQLGWPSGEQIWRLIFESVYAQARQAVLDRAAQTGANAREYACTLLCAALSADLLVVAQLGDGLAVAATGPGEWFVAAAPQRGEYANETYFLVQPQAVSHVAVSVYAEGIESLAVMTDGLLRLVLDVPSVTPHAPFFNPLVSFAHAAPHDHQANDQLADFLNSDRVSARTDDDKTLVLAVRWPPSAAPA